MLWLNMLSLLDASTVIIGGGGGEEAVAVEGVAAEVVSAGGPASIFGGAGGLTIMFVYAAVIGGMWFFMIRPQRKREREIRQMQDSLKVGDDVITSAGFYGRVVSVGEDCFVVEFGTNKGVRIPVRKTDIVGSKAPNLGGGTTE